MINFIMAAFHFAASGPVWCLLAVAVVTHWISTIIYLISNSWCFILPSSNEHVP